MEKLDNTNHFSVETQDKDESSDEVPENPKQNQTEPTSSIEKNVEIASTDEKISNEVDEILEPTEPSESEESDTLEKRAECSHMKVEMIGEESKDENVDDIAQSIVKSESFQNETELTEPSTFSDVKSQKKEIFENKSLKTSAERTSTEVEEEKGKRDGEFLSF